MSFVNVLALLLILIGAINAGLWGFFKFDFFYWIFMNTASTVWPRLIYAIIGLAGVWGLSFLGKCRALCCRHKD